MSNPRTPMPFSLGLTLDRAIARYRSHALGYMAIATILQIPIVIGVAIAQPTLVYLSAKPMMRWSTSDIITCIILLPSLLGATHALNIFSQAVVIQRAIHIARAPKPTFAQCFIQVFRHPLRISILALISFIIHIISLIGCTIIVFYFIVGEIMLFSSQAEHTRLLTGVFLLALYLMMSLVQARIILAIPISIAEQLGVRASINRSWALTAGAWVPTYLCGAIITGLYALCILGVQLALQSFLPQIDDKMLARTCALIICLPAMGLIRLQLYVHQRTRREGDDIAARMAQVGYGAE